MATLFYIILVAVSEDIAWSWGWFVVSLIFSAISEGKTIYKYKYTRDASLDGEESEEELG